jgi:hypothetical protein
VKLAIYKGKGRIGNAIVRWWKRSKYSHCELVIQGLCFSSSVMDGGVRAKQIDLKPEHWDLIDLPWADESFAFDYFLKTNGEPYSWAGIFWSQVFGREYDEPKAAFCSDWCAAALKIPSSTIYSPESLGKLCQFLTELTKANSMADCGTIAA